MLKFSKTTGAVIAAYIVLALAVILPLLLNNHKLLIGDDSAGLSFWATWWPAHAIPHNYDLVYSHYILFPANTNLLPALSLVSSVFYHMLRPVFGAVWAYNLLLPLYTILNSVFTFVYIRRYTGREWYAAVAGGVVALNPITFELARSGNIPLTGFFVVILWLMLWDRFIQKPALAQALMVVVGLYAIVLMSMHYWPFIFTVCVPYAIYHLQRLPDRKPYIDALLPGGLILIALLLIFPVGPAIWSSIMPRFPALSLIPSAGEFGLLMWVFLAVFARLMIWAIRRLPADFPIRGLWLTIITLNLIAYILPAWSPLALLGLVSPEHLAHSMVLWLPILFGTVLLIVISLDTMSLSFSQRQLAIGIIILVVLSGWWQLLPSTTLNSASFYDTIAADPEDYLVADFPMGVDSLERRIQPNIGDNGVFGIDDFAGHSLMNAVSHQKPVIGGLSASLPSRDITVFEETPLLRLLGNAVLEEGDRETGARIRDDVARWRVGYIVVHADQLTPDFVGSIHRWLNWTNAFCVAASEGSYEFWRATWHPAGCSPFTLHLGDPDAAMALGNGWYSPEDWGDQQVRWAGGQTESLVSAWLNPQADYELLIRASAPQTETQTLTVVVNGEGVGSTNLKTDWDDYVFSIPRALIEEDGFVAITLQHEQLTDSEGRSLTAAYDYLLFQEVAS